MEVPEHMHGPSGKVIKNMLPKINTSTNMTTSKYGTIGTSIRSAK